MKASISFAALVLAKWHLMGVEARLSPNGIPFGEMAIGDFPPLSCNDGIDIVACEPWSSMDFDLSFMVDIPCGTCVNFDLPEGSSIELISGLNIEGKLVFPPNTKATIETPFIFVQGVLEASSNQTISTDTIDGLNFVMTGTQEHPFYPNEQNSASCDDTFCNVGKKPVIVAGGRLDIQGVDDTCPTWVKLIDVVRDDNFVIANEYPRMPIPPPSCSPEVINEDFDSGEGQFKSSLGCMDSLETEEDGNKYFHTRGRSRSWQGPFLNVGTFLRDCMIEDQVYLVRGRYRLTHEEDGSFSNCHTNGTDCLALSLHTMDQEEEMKWRTLFETTAVAKSVDNEWTDFNAAIEFKAGDFNATALYQMLYFSGPEEGVTIDIDDIVFTLPWEAHFPDPNSAICGNLLTNGDANVDNFSPYPFKLMGNLGSYLRVKTEEVNGTANNYFSITGREAAWTSISQDLITDCVVANSIYTFKMKVRVHSVEPTTVRFTLKTKLEDPEAEPDYEVESIGNCPPASDSTGWVQCERKFLFQKKHEDARGIDLQFIVQNNNIADIDYDDIEVTQFSPPVTKYVLPRSILNCWGVGADIVQTSHTLKHGDFNKVNITDIEDEGEGGNAIVTIGTPIAKPTTEQDDPRFAVEVAILSRNIVFQSKDDDAAFPLHGGHLAIMHSPETSQKIAGIDFRNFGQQGNFGRYPIHFHMSGSQINSVISRNTVRHSNQRCIVIHGTHNVTLEFNIAFDTFGHCFMLEDGIEQDNKFHYNLGLETKIMPDENLLSIAESDMFPSTFWISNPLNYFLGNVAAGSEDTGFWYEMLEFIRGASTKFDPTYDINPTKFKFGWHRNNIMHSNHGDGFKLYPNGFFPEVRAVFEGVHSFRNVGDGVLLHNSKNLGLDGGVFADNRRQIEVDKQADDVTVTNSVIIGFSELYRLEVEMAKRKSHCPAWRPMVGIQLHSFLRFRDSKGYQLKNLTFQDFGEEIGCVGSTALEMDDQVRDGHFDAFSTISNLTFPEGIPSGEKFNMCSLEANPLFLHDLVIEDATGSLNPDNNGVPGVVISNSSKMTAFGGGNCTDMPGSCSLFCVRDLEQGNCYRSINIATWETSVYEELVLEVTDGAGKTQDFEGYFETVMKAAIGGEIPDDYENTVYQRRRYYSPILPYGNYTLRFKKQDADYWPQFVEVAWDDPPTHCDSFIDDNTTTLIVPEASEEQCENIIRNPGGELGTADFWAHTGGGVKVVAGNPADKTTRSGSYAISSVMRVGAWHGIGQYLDTRCLTTGRKYEIIVRIRLQDPEGNYLNCNINRVDFNAFDVCPRVTFRLRKMEGNEIGDDVQTSYAYPLASAVGPWEADKWNLLYGTFQVTESMAEADSVLFFIERGRGGVELIVDDVLIQPTFDHDCKMPVYNTDFEVADTRYWKSIGTTEIDIYSPGHNSDYALRTTMRKEYWGSMLQDLNKDCLVEGDSYSVSGMIKLLDSNDSIYDCDPSLQWGTDGMEYICPTLTLRVTTGAQTEDIDIGNVPGPFKNQDWNAIHGLFEVSSDMLAADSVSIYMRKTKANIDIVLDDFTVTKLTVDNDSDVISNGDFSSGDARFFNVQMGGVIDVWPPEGVEGDGGYDDKYSLIVSDRSYESYGVRYAIDNSKLKTRVIYKFRCQVYLIHEDHETLFECNPNDLYGDKRCPVVSLRSQNRGGPPLTRVIVSAPDEFKTGFWNEFSGVLEFLPAEVNAESLSLIIDKAPPHIDMLIDSIELWVPNVASDSPSSAPSFTPTSASPTAEPSLNPTAFNETER